MTVHIEMGRLPGGGAAALDLQELLASRLLVQGNSGSGKSHLLRRLLEQSAGQVQQVVIDPEGDFGSLAAEFGHLVIEAADHSEAETTAIAARVRQHRVSVVLNLEGLDVDAQLRCAGAFLNRLFDAPRDQWYPALVVVDEAQLFAPAAAGDIGEEARRISLGAMTNLMCRGRKRGLAGVIATQRLAKLAKNVAAEASNFLMGRTFLDIDMARAADLLGMERRQAEQIRDLARGQFLALGPALARRPALVTIGDVRTSGAGGTYSLAPLPSFEAGDRRSLLFDALEPEAPPPPPRPAPPPVERMFAAIAAAAPEPAQQDLLAVVDTAPAVDAVLADMVAEEHARDMEGQPMAALHHDFSLRLRMRGVAASPLSLADFARRLALARAGLFSDDLTDEGWAAALRLSEQMPDDLLGVFMSFARAARDAAPCPSEAEIARTYGTGSLGRVRRLLAYMETKGFIALRVDLRGRRTAAIPQLGWTTGPEVEAAA